MSNTFLSLKNTINVNNPKINFKINEIREDCFEDNGGLYIQKAQLNNSDIRILKCNLNHNNYSLLFSVKNNINLVINENLNKEFELNILKTEYHGKIIKINRYCDIVYVFFNNNLQKDIYNFYLDYILN